ncbi:hypothetical protein [Anaeromicropila herbilytica]|uniref:Uncharacterized protein n=1 Tax=Anaeromicropila herbilytica TaxID=2785025 RepID=A0A7R7ELB5_9FIRM|nr:hypothetical protein [Anaeromicropila herbilytica]BCN30897.1 hypothetical protein bsdtb5_21920 [Anaeromicropila herbilytica]
MNITFVNPGIDYMIESIMNFQTEKETPFWSDALYRFYPQLDKDYVQNLGFTERKEYIESTLRTVYIELEDVINQKILIYCKHWEDNKEQIINALSEAFEIDCNPLFNELYCNVSMNPISPRYLEEQCFEVFYLNSERGALGVSIHEIIHMVWFYVWNQLFGDSYTEYERPSMKWILSEMVVESIMKDPRLSSLNPYFPREKGGCIYSYFFDMKVDNTFVLDTIDELYSSQGIKEFMKNSYDFCLNHETEIRNHIERSEKI